MSQFLPLGWTKIKLERAVEILDSQRVPLNSTERSQRIAGKSAKDLVTYYGATGPAGFTNDHIFDEPLILLGEDGVPFYDPFKHKAYRITGRSWVNNHAHVLREKKGLTDSRYIEAFLNSFDYTGYVSGSTRLKLTQNAMKQIPIPLAPFAEQKRIADKLDTVLARVDACSERLDRVALILKRFRQSVLAAAVSGKLTTEWCDEELSSKPPSNTLRTETARNLWKSTSLSDLCIAIFDGPFGSNLKSDDYASSGIRVVRLENIGHLRFNADKATYVPIEKYEGLERHTIFPGDILFSSFVDEEVRVCRLPHDLPTLAINKADCFCIQINEKLVSATFLTYRLASKLTYLELKEQVHGATRPRINLKQLKQYVFDLPPIKEQHEIVRRVETLFAFADRLEARLATARTAAERLTPALLAKAFRGELVPQDPNDEPASVLLQRLAAAQSEGGVKPKRTKKPAPKTAA